MPNNDTNPTSAQLIAVDPKIAEIVESMRREAGENGELTVKVKEDFGKLTTVSLTWVAPKTLEMWELAGRMVRQASDVGNPQRHEYPKSNTVVVTWQYRLEMK